MAAAKLPDIWLGGVPFSTCGSAESGRAGEGLAIEDGPGARGGGASRSVLVERDFVDGSGKGAGGGGAIG